MTYSIKNLRRWMAAGLAAGGVLVTLTLLAPRPSEPADAPTPAPIRDSQFELCQSLGPAAPHCIEGVDAAHESQFGCAEGTWDAIGPIPWQAFAQGEYVGHERTVHVPVYRLRVDDVLELVYRLTRRVTDRPYELNVGDEIHRADR